MYSFENKIKSLLFEHSETIEQLSEKINISARTLFNIFATNEASTKIINKIADYYDVPITYFFEEVVKGEKRTSNSKKEIKKEKDENTNNHEITNFVLRTEVEYLKQSIKDKEEIISLLKQKILNANIT